MIQSSGSPIPCPRSALSGSPRPCTQGRGVGGEGLGLARFWVWKRLVLARVWASLGLGEFGFGASRLGASFG